MSDLILICAATGVEAGACRKAFKSALKSGTRFEILQTGMGLARAEHALSKRLREGLKPSLILSIGFAGSLSKDLGIGSWVTSDCVVFDALRASCAPLSAVNRLSFPVQSVALRSVSGVYSTAESERVAVDMESFALARLSNEAGLPFSVLRMISDNPDAPLPESIAHFASALTQGTATSRMSSIATALRKTAQSPMVFGNFIVRSMSLPGKLEAGLREFAERVL